ncbi:MAG TPA: energy-dependent translational throttle protein EttA [Planctomycetota bacterium]|jgi:ATP-binding cassette ChvD family protein|nr:energy-dependent translational throttle protein EttA [Planctomycetota bacterium]
MPDKIIFQLQDLHKFFGQREVLKGITLSFLEGAKIGVIGPNGAGKSTLLRILAGVDKQFEGTAKPVGNLSIGYLAQEPPLNEDLDVYGNLREAVQPLLDIEARYNALTEAGDMGDEFNHLSELMEHKEIWELDSHLELAAEALGLPPMEADVKKLSGGERRRVALCKLLLNHPDMLLLDEPTNHLDTDAVEWLEHHLQAYSGTVILITHDRYFLDNVVGWMLEIERGRGRPYQGNYSEYLQQKQNELETKRGQNEQREKVIARELEWIRKTPKARSTRSKSRIARYKELVEQKAEEAMDAIELRIPPGPRLGTKVIELKHVNKGFGDRELMKDLSFEIPPGGVLGVIGHNGVGKTTFLKMLVGKEKPDSGEVVIGSTVKLTWLDQSRTILDDTKSVYDNITEGNPQIPFGNKLLDGRAYVARFNFKGEDQQKLLGECSGGMRNRVLLAKMLRHPANVILLDEPTNDLDLETLRVLEEAIQEYPGSAIVVTHDRYFLNRVATHILAFEGDGVVRFFDGDYEQYHEWREKDRAARGVAPVSKAGKYKKLLRT